MKKNIFALSLLLTIFLAGCKKEELTNDNNTNTIPRSGLELLADPAAETYIVAVMGGDTVIMQNTDGITNTTNKQQYSNGGYYVSDLITGFSTSSKYFLLHFDNRVQTSIAGSMPDFDCALADDIMEQASYPAGAILAHPYNVALQTRHNSVNYDSDTYYRSGYDSQAPTLTFKENKVTGTKNGCTQRRVRGEIAVKCRGLCPGNPVVTYTIAFCCNLGLPS